MPKAAPAKKDPVTGKVDKSKLPYRPDLRFKKHQNRSKYPKKGDANPAEKESANVKGRSKEKDKKEGKE